MLLMEKHAADERSFRSHQPRFAQSITSGLVGIRDIKSGVYFTTLTQKKVFNVAFTAYESSGTQGEWSSPAASNSLDKKLHDADTTFVLRIEYSVLVPAFTMVDPEPELSRPFESGVEPIPGITSTLFSFFDRSHLDKASPARPMWQP
jgi:hypothetical protein